MKILFLAHRIPYPPNKGDKIRSFNQIEYLSRNHRVHLACFVDSREDWVHVKNLEKYCVSVDAVYRSRAVSGFQAGLEILGRKPLTIAAFHSREMAARIKDRLRNETFDAIIVFSSAMAEYVKDIRHIPKIMDFIDVDSRKWKLYSDHSLPPMSWVYRLEAGRLGRYEEEMAREFDHSVLVSEKEVRDFSEKVPGRPITAVSNGVDLDYFKPGENFNSSPKPPSVVFTGAMDYFPNVDAVTHFCRDIFPLVRKEIPKAIFYIVGRNPTRAVRKLGRDSNVVVTGSVPDIRPYLRAARVAVVPLRIACGLQNKILEAMAMGVPVVSTSNTCDWMGFENGVDILIADTPVHFSDSIVHLINDSQFHDRVARNGRKFMEEKYSWDFNLSAMEDILKGTEIRK